MHGCRYISYIVYDILDFCVVQGMFPKHKSCNAKERTLQKRWRQSSQACITVLLYSNQMSRSSQFITYCTEKEAFLLYYAFTLG
jgi:hypothetical protein